VNSQASPGALRRVACLIYEGVLLIAVWMFAALVFLLIFGDATVAPARYFFQLYLWLISGVYFVWNWTRGGQTLAMQTWRIRLSCRNGQPLTLKLAIRRYVLASLFFGLGFLWALFDRDGLSLHDRLSGTRLGLLEKRKSKA
jgi:uncharacterized RDD family membrane protein YckC